MNIIGFNGPGSDSNAKIRRNFAEGVTSQDYLRPLQISYDPQQVSLRFTDLMQQSHCHTISKVLACDDVGFKQKTGHTQTSSNIASINNQNQQNMQRNNFHLTLPNVPLLNVKSVESNAQTGDSPNGDVNFFVGEKISQRYEIKVLLGKGSFGQVFKAFDCQTQTLVAIKIIKNKKAFYEQGKFELHLLKYVNENDAMKKYIVVCLDCFTLANHLCIVFELLYLNLYELLKLRGFQGLPLEVVKVISFQLLEVLSFLKTLGIIHCDLKPENILLVDNNSYIIKVADMGSSCYLFNKPYKYIQSRFYRSPEVILDLGYDHAIDMWSLGCVMIELTIGEALFRGNNEIDQISCMMEVLGSIPDEMIRTSPKAKEFFTYHPVTDEYLLRESSSIKTFRPIASKPLATILIKSLTLEAEIDETILFENLVLHILSYKSNYRIDPNMALCHLFFHSKKRRSNDKLWDDCNNKASFGLSNCVSHQKNNIPISTRYPSNCYTHTAPSTCVSYPTYSNYFHPHSSDDRCSNEALSLNSSTVSVKNSNNPFFRSNLSSVLCSSPSLNMESSLDSRNRSYYKSSLPGYFLNNPVSSLASSNIGYFYGINQPAIDTNQVKYEKQSGSGHTITASDNLGLYSASYKHMLPPSTSLLLCSSSCVCRNNSYEFSPSRTTDSRVRSMSYNLPQHKLFGCDRDTAFTQTNRLNLFHGSFNNYSDASLIYPALYNYLYQQNVPATAHKGRIH